MNSQSKDPADHSEKPSPQAAPAPELSSDRLDMLPSPVSADAQTEFPLMPTPIIGVSEDADEQTSPAPDAVTQPKTPSKNTKTTTKPKGKPRPKRANSTKAAGANKRAAEEPGVTSDAGTDPPVDEGAPVITCLQGVHIEPGALSPPVATLPPQLGSLFPNMAEASAVLAVTAAAAGHGVQLDTNMIGDGSSSALRVAFVGEERHLPQAVAPVLQAAYALEQKEVQRWSAEKQKVNLQSVADAVRRRLYQQTLANAGLLGLAGLSDSLNSPILAPSSALPRPRFLLRDPGQKDVTRALEAAESGVLLVDGRRLPTMAGFGNNYDTLTANLVNTAASGRLLELVDPRLADCIRMRPVVVSVIGTLSTIDTYGLHKAGSTALAATVFVPSEENSKLGPTAGAVTTLTEILGRVRVLAAASQEVGSPLRFSVAARKTLEQAKTKLARVSTEVLPPLANYYGATADLVRRIALALHLLDHAARQADTLPTEIGKDVVARAVAFVEQSVLPAARNVLAAASVDSDVRNARRILSYVQQYCSPEYPAMARRDVVRIFQRTMPVPTVDQAIRRLVADGLLIASNPDVEKGGSHVFQVHPVVFDATHQLPDLVTDPRRHRQ